MGIPNSSTIRRAVRNVALHEGKRQSAGPPPDSNASGKGTTAVIIVVSLAIILTVTFFTYITLRTLRINGARPKYLPTASLKRKWENWTPKAFFGSRKLNRTSTTSSNLGYPIHGTNSSVPTLHLRSADRSARASTQNLADPERNAGDGAQTLHEPTGVDRQTSVRSVMTLPAYSPAARPSERILGREGERDGIDIVLEAPETVDEEEARREEEMESLYQIRQSRRNEAEEREDRRRRRREARERGDHAELRRLMLESEAAAERRRAGRGATATLIAEHQSRPRERRVSSVSYAELGVARHDGSRVRAGSGESMDRRPLLDEAAGMGNGGGGASIRSSSIGAFRPPWTHARESSTGSLRSLMSDAASSTMSVDGGASNLPPFGRAGSDFEIVTLNTTNSNGGVRPHSRTLSSQYARSRASSAAGLSLRTSTTDLIGNSSPAAHPATNDAEPLNSEHAASDIHGEPPAYHAAAPSEGFEDAPPYTSPVRERHRDYHQEPAPSSSEAAEAGELSTTSSRAPVKLSLLPEIQRLPSIRIAVATPTSPSGRAQSQSQIHGIAFPDF